MQTDAAPPSTSSADALRAALAEAGVRAEVAAEGRLAVLVAELQAVVDPAVRRRVVALARAQGFTHVAVELVEGETR